MLQQNILGTLRIAIDWMLLIEVGLVATENTLTNDRPTAW